MGQDLGQLLHDVGPNTSATYKSQGAVMGNSQLAETFLLKIQLEESRKAYETLAEDMKGLQKGQQWAYDNVTKLQCERTRSVWKDDGE